MNSIDELSNLKFKLILDEQNKVQKCKELAFKKRQIRRTCLRTSFFDTNFKEFDPGSGRTLAARLTHASRTVKESLLSGSVADG